MSTYLIETLKAVFSEKFATDADVIIQSPGRINLIGEHTDYNDGFVLPAAIDHYMLILIKRNGTKNINLYSYDYSHHYSESLCAEIEKTDNSWVNLILKRIPRWLCLGVEDVCWLVTL